MSIFQCSYCKEMKDADHDGCEEHPGDPSKLVCTECEEEIEKGLKERQNPAWDMSNIDYF